jgi:hypothetical protein
MRKYHHTARGGLILAAILTAGAACADVWPSWLSPAQGGYDRGNQALSGAVERLTVVAGPDAWTNYMTTNLYASYFSQWAKCDAAKRILSAAVVGGYYVFPTTNFIPDNAVYVGKSNLLARIGAPTNWWDVTPRFNLAMETNGWRLMPAAMSNVVWVQDGWPSSLPIWYSETNAQLSQINPGGTWSTAASSPDLMNFAWASATNDAKRQASDFYWTIGATFMGQPLDGIEFVGESAVRVSALDTFDTQGDPVSTNFFTVLVWTNAVGGVSPTWNLHTNQTAQPTNISAGKIGWSYDAFGEYGSSMLLKYNGTTNGFKWFR